jgi:hypothetical protein
LWLSRKAALRDDQSRAFIFGCGRSGTTILGDVLDTHQEITHYHEPVSRWAAVDPRTDLWRIFVPWRSASLLEDEDITPRSRRNFERLFPGKTKTILDKSPDHIYRLGYLAGLDPQAKFIHMVRDGRDVAQSIVPVAESSVPVVGGHRWNLWWGMDDAKWEFIVRVANARDYISHSVAEASTQAERGLCEWLICLNELRLHREVLGPRLLEIRYQDLVEDPELTLAKVVSFVGLEARASWLEGAAAMVSVPRSRQGDVVTERPELLLELDRARREHALPDI